MANKEAESSLKLEGLHPTLKIIFEVGAEVASTLSSSIKRAGDERTALNLSYQYLADKNKIIDRESIYASGRLKTRIRYAIKKRYFAEFSVEKDEKIESYSLAIGLNNVNSDESGVDELKIIASDLQKVYGLPYTPNIYVNGKRLQAKSD